MTKWLAAAAALHAGALERRKGVFGCTETAVSYLCNYHVDESSSVGPELVEAAKRDYFYHPENVGGSLGLSSFFKQRESESCVLCSGAGMSFDREAGQHKLFVEDCYCSGYHALGQAALNLCRLKHLAAIHTPYFVMLFVSLVEKKRYTFHRNPRELKDMARNLLSKLGSELSERNEDRELCESANVLNLWWRYQDKQSSRASSGLNMSIPSYFHLGMGYEPRTWTPSSDVFDIRNPEPFYSFVKNNCLCHKLRTSNRVRVQGGLWQGALVRVCELHHAGSAGITFVLSVLLSRQHLEQTLHNAIRAHKHRWVMPGTVLLVSVKKSSCIARWVPRWNALHWSTWNAPHRSCCT